MPILVTGGSGFIGSQLVGSLLKDGESVRVLTRDPVRARLTLPPEVELETGDLTDPAALRRAVRGCRLVYHVAGSFRDNGIPDQRHFAVHVEGTRHLLEASRAEGVERFIHTSTIGVVGHIAHPPADETWPYAPGDAYQRSKAEAERMVLEYRARHDFPLVVVRPASVYGPGDRRFLKLFKAVQRRVFAMLGSGKVLLHPVYVTDLVQGFRLAACRSQAIGEVLILGGGVDVTLNELVQTIAEVLNVRPPRLRLPAWPFQLLGSACERVCIPLGITPPIFRRRVDFFTKSRGFTIRKARRVLGYEPAVPLRQGLAETAAWYLAQGLL